MATALDSITIRGFKSVKEMEGFKLNSLNILIGGNGDGKSNFIEVFKLLNNMAHLNLSTYIQSGGGADGFLYNGPKETEEVAFDFVFGNNSYGFCLKPTADERFVVIKEYESYLGRKKGLYSTGLESSLTPVKDEQSKTHPGYSGVGHYVYHAIVNWVVYHFHDTGATAPMRRSEIVEDNARLRPDAANIAPFMYHLSDSDQHAYATIVDTIRLVTPFFDDFILKPVKNGDAEKVKLMWRQKGSDYPLQPYHFSDGTLRFICLVTALLQPNPPSTILIDEPELGLHPYAIEILTELIKSISQKTQIIISTQSPSLIDGFEAGDIVTVNRKDGGSTFERLNAEELSNWLKDYSLGELWRKNVFAGGPAHE